MSDTKYVYQVRDIGPLSLLPWEVVKEGPKQYEAKRPESYTGGGYFGYNSARLKKSDAAVFIDLCAAGEFYKAKLAERVESARNNLNAANANLAKADKVIRKLREMEQSE